ncbi:MAG: cytochrome ubiquinol oxidase subunit I [Anaerolineae bacterium]
MDPVLLSRIQFGLTAAFHFLFPPITIGLSWLIAYIGWRYLRTGDEQIERTMFFWIRLFGLLFAVGVASGIAMEFQFGTNWSTYSRFVGDIFGSPLAAEGVFAFFLESSFVGVLILGRKKVSKGFYWFSSLMVALGSTLSAFWIIVANSWQQTPTAYRIVGEGVFRRAELTDFLAAVFNPSTLPRYMHTVIASIFTGGLFMAAVSAWYLLRKQHVEFARRSFSIGIVAAAVFSLLILVTGHYHSVQVALTQPAKMAAFEGLFQTQRGADLVVWGFPDAARQTVHLRIALPNLLSFLIYFDPNASVTGLDQIARADWPPIELSFYPYHIMILLGGWFILLPWLGLFLGRKRFTSPAYLKAVLYSWPLPWVALELGWMAAEFGRQPWVVYGLLRTKEAASVVVPAGQILATIILFALVYLALLALAIFLVRREIAKGPEGVSVPSVAVPASATAKSGR